MGVMSNKTINYNIYDRSSGKAEIVGDTTSYKRPSIEMPTDTFKGPGILGEIDLPTYGQISAMEVEINFKKSNAKAVSLFGQELKHLEIRWVNDALDTSTGKIKTVSNKEIIKGIPKKIDLGSIESNTGNDTTIGFEVTYYQYILDGVSIIEIDKLNNVMKINGIDYTSQIREAL